MSQNREDFSKRCELVEHLNLMRDVDIRTVNVSELKDIEAVSIDTSLPIQERVESFVEQIGNPYCYKSHGVIVKISFSGHERLEDCLANCISLE